MASLITTIPSFVFPYELNQLTISSYSKVHISIHYNNKQILNTSLFPIDGTIELDNLSSLIVDYLKSEISELRIVLDGLLVASTKVVPNNLDVDVTAQECRLYTFLTRTTVKYTHPAAKELLHFVYNSETRGSVTAVAIKNGVVSTREQQLSFTLSGGIATLDVSPSVLFSLDDYKLVEYTVRVGERTMKYKMIPNGMVDTLHEYGFINSFLQEEYITLMGDAERELKTERMHAYIGGLYRNFKVEPIPHWTISTIIPDGMAGTFDDFIAAEEVWRKTDSCLLAVVDSKDTTSSSSSAVNEGSITLREAGRTYRHRPVRPVRTFDKTFDDTFL